MADIRPFRALRPLPDFAFRLASRPYDVLNTEEARGEALHNPLSFYHISRSEIDLPPGTAPHSPEVYGKAADNLQQFIRERILLMDDSPCFYIYALTMNGKVQTGLIGLSSLDDYDRGSIKKHELTRPDKEMDRVCHILATGAQTGNVFLAYEDHEGINQIITDWTGSHDPVYDFQASDGIYHRLWVVDKEKIQQRVRDLFAQEVPCTYIADGHHRAASASIVRHTLSTEGKINSADDPANFFLTTLFPASQLTILEYNRVVKDLNGMDTDEFLARLSVDFTIVPGESTAMIPSAPHEFGMYLDKKWWQLKAKTGSYADNPIGVLDVTILQEKVLDPLLGIKDPRTDDRVEFIGGIRGTGELIKRVDNREMRVAFILYPVTIRQLFEIADKGQIMPPKSTWFEPKLRDGLVTHCIR
ncbi:MAG TPA: DUF1015 family protein [Chitinophagaceae bacterium]|nr:DUF1015 family protein [Chitinophagaceae bacterium]